MKISDKMSHFQAGNTQSGITLAEIQYLTDKVVLRQFLTAQGTILSGRALYLYLY